jgi:hypothetical protein
MHKSNILKEYPMSFRTMKFSSRTLVKVAAVVLASVSLAGCVYYPGGYGYGYGPGYAVAPPVGVVVGGGWGWHGGDDD